MECVALSLRKSINPLCGSSACRTWVCWRSGYTCMAAGLEGDTDGVGAVAPTKALPNTLSSVWYWLSSACPSSVVALTSEVSHDRKE